MNQIARFGGYLARRSDGPPGNAVIWRGLSRLTDIEFGFMVGAQNVGNLKPDQTVSGYLDFPQRIPRLPQARQNRTDAFAQARVLHLSTSELVKINAMRQDLLA